MGVGNIRGFESLNSNITDITDCRGMSLIKATRRRPGGDPIGFLGALELTVFEVAGRSRRGLSDCAIDNITMRLFW